jgi:hypothetical protein
MLDPVKKPKDNRVLEKFLLQRDDQRRAKRAKARSKFGGDPLGRNRLPPEKKAFERGPQRLFFCSEQAAFKLLF